MAASRKLYREVAQTLNNHLMHCHSEQIAKVIQSVAEGLASDFKQDNMAFQRDTFLDAVNKGYNHDD